MQWLKPPPPIRATSDTRRGLLWLAAGFAALFAAAPAPAQLVLPAPLTDPRAIDFTTDPVLNFLTSPTPGDAFATAVAAAVIRHPALIEAAATPDTASAQRREVRAALVPTLSAALVGSQSLTRDFIDTSAAVERLLPRGRADAGITADQLLFDFGATNGRIAGATARLRAATAETDRAATDIALSAAQAWHQIIAYQALVELSDARIGRHRTIVSDTRDRVTAGVGAGGDIARAETGLADAIGDGARNARSLAAAQARYREIFKTDPAKQLSRPQITAPALTLDAAMTRSHRTPEVITAEALAESARAEARATRADALSHLSAGVAATRYNVFGAGPNHDVRGQFLLRQTLSTGGAEAARTTAATARARAATAAADRTRHEAERDAAAALADAQILAVAVTALGDAYRANRRNRDIMAEQFRLSRGSLIDLLRTEDDYFAAASPLILGSIERDLAAYTLLARTDDLLRHFAIPPAR